MTDIWIVREQTDKTDPEWAEYVRLREKFTS